jgi:hypothetical protein
VVHSLSFNALYLPLGYSKPFDNQSAGLVHVHLPILGFYKGQKNLFAPVFRKFFGRGTSSSGSIIHPGKADGTHQYL